MNKHEYQNPRICTISEVPAIAKHHNMNSEELLALQEFFHDAYTKGWVDCGNVRDVYDRYEY